MDGITGVILTKNEEKRIAKAILSLDFCREIIVIDDNSADNTKQIAVKLGAKVFQRALETDFASQRNFAIEKSKHDWILYLDADEEISHSLKNEILMAVKTNQHDAYLIKRRDYWMGKEMKFGETGKARSSGIIRLLKKGSGLWNGNVHEIYNTSKRIGRLQNFINHYPHPAVSDFINDVNFYSTLRAKELFRHHVQVNLFQIIFYPLFKFVLTYFIYLGFLDGPQGFIYSFLMSFHSFLVRSKLYQYYHIDPK